MSAAQQLPVLAIVGRPNVGKSTLFNRIAGRRIAIVHELPGVTRDRICAPARWRGKRFEVVDTGGIAFADEALAAATQRQAEVAIEMAQAVILVVDVTAGVTPLDIEVARKLRASGKKILLAVNKVDNEKRQAGVAEFFELGFERLFPIAAVHGSGVDALLDAATEDFAEAGIAEEPAATRIAIVGRPNVGKSSLINCILQSERTIVSELPGTTRDSVDVPFRLGEKSYVLIDTAGLRHKRKIKTSVDQFGLMRAERSIRNCDIAVLVLDAMDGVTKQDKRIAGLICEAQRGCLIAVNKWDLAMAAQRTAKEKKSFPEQYRQAVRQQLFFLDWAPVLFVSAKTGEGVGQIFHAVQQIQQQMTRRVDTPALNRLLGRALQSYPPPIQRGRRFKIYYAFQKPGTPPTFRLFVNDPASLTPHYQRYLLQRIRAAWGFSGCPVLLECQRRERRSLVKSPPNSTRD
jgi:GTP-binding protein